MSENRWTVIAVGIAALMLSLAAFVLAWFQTGLRTRMAA
jgi:hypothetical protein